jgi:glycosyltransferase involved in cell wall biosynthesis
MAKSSKISVIIPCFNHGTFLPEAVASVIGIGRDDVELIVVDDGSTDERTRRELDTLAGQGINVIRQENKGLAAARNAGILASQGKYILPLDADDRLRPGWIDGGIRILDSSSQVGVIYGDAQRFGQRNDRWITGAFDTDQLLCCNYIHASALYRRSVWEQNHGYDGTMPVQGFEDWDFWLGALEHGWQFAYVPEIFFEYRIAGGSMITRTRGFENQIEEFIALKHAHLYRNAWVRHQQSLRWALGNFLRLLGLAFRRRIRGLAAAARVRVWHPLLHITRPVRLAIGLDQHTLQRWRSKVKN